MRRYSTAVTPEAALALVIVPAGLWLAYLALDYPFLSRLLPLGALTIITVGIVRLCFIPERKIDIESLFSREFLKLPGVIVLLFLYSILFKYTGFFVSTPIFMVLGSIILGVGNWKWTLGGIVILNLLIWLIFVHYLEVPLP